MNLICYKISVFCFSRELHLTKHGCIAGFIMRTHPLISIKPFLCVFFYYPCNVGKSLDKRFDDFGVEMLSGLAFYIIDRIIHFQAFL